MINNPAIAHPAATLILVREKGDSQGLEVYLTRRDSRLKFLGDFFVFPGGRRDEEDFSELALSRMRAKNLRAKAEKVESEEPEPARLGYYATAIREAFEEAGILLACQEKGEPILFSQEIKKELEYLRTKLHQGEISFLKILLEFNWYYDLERLFWFAHWITPKTSPKRFDTQFFVAQLPEGQMPRAYSEEVAEALWICPSEALQKWKQNQMKMIPPTLASLDRLSHFKSFTELIQSRKQ